ncbi:MAG: DUF2937 family protein [Nevskiaceae bacterium]|nr:MAG: DUF2937 family protein [Nevskiaceae bacterium]TBR72066.1 MAG: DUF2937 family protein [Nevskiaceae bacterium]
MSFLPRYLIVALFGAVLLGGVQVPNFVHQYAQRVDAHFQQVQQDLAGFRAVAVQYFHGDLAALVAAHDTSPDPRFRAEGVPLHRMMDSERQLAAQHAGLSGPVYEQTVFVALHGDRALLRETWAGYKAAFLLDRDALVMGIALAFGVCFVVEFLLLLLRTLFTGMTRKRALRP